MRIRILAAIAAVSLILTAFTGCYQEVDDNSSQDNSVATSDKSNNSENESDTIDTGSEDNDLSENADTSTTDAPGTSSTTAPKDTTSTTKVPPAKTNGSKFENFRDFNAYAQKLSNNLRNDLWYSDASGTKLYGGVESAKRRGDPVTLWGYGAYLESAGANLAANPKDATAKAEYIKALTNLSMYVDKSKSNDKQLAYHCWADPNGRSEIFFDDNVWILHELINAYNLLGEKKYLDLAKRNTAYILNDGWDETLGGGGLYWEDKTTCGDKNHPPQKNTCINAPMAFALTELYEITKDVSYKNWAVKIYRWTMDNLYDNENHVFWDRIEFKDGGDGNLIKNVYSYNVGNMISAASGLYKITKEKKYLTDANNFAEGAFKRFLMAFPVDGEDAYIWTDQSAWFNSSLIKGYIKLYDVNKDAGKKYIIPIRTSLAVACLRTKDTSGYLPTNWTKADPLSDKDKDLLNQAATARCLYMLHKWTQDTGK